MKSKNWLFLIVQVVALLGIVISIIIGHFNKSAAIDINSFESDYVEYENGCHISEGDVNVNDGKVTLLVSDDIELTAGTYTVYVWYKTDSDQTIFFRDGGDTLFSSSDYSCLRNYTDVYSYDFTIKNIAKEFNVVIDYDGKGNLDISRVAVCRNQNNRKRALIWTILIFALIDLCYVFRETIRRNYKVAITLLGAWFLPAIPLFNDSSCLGYDYTYHTLRVEAIARELENGVFPARMNSLFFGGAGYPSSIFYNDFFLYVPAVLRRMGFYIWESNNFYFMFISALAVGIAYFSFRKMFANNSIAAILTLLYVSSPYRLDMYYEGSGIGIVTAYTFVPLVALGVWEMYANTDGFECKKTALYITLGMSGLIGCHILTTEVVCFALIIVVFSRIRTTFNKKVLKTWLMAIIASVVLNLYFLIPFLDYYLSVDTQIKGTVANSLLKIQVFGMSISEYFAFFTNPLDGVLNNFQCSPGLVLMAALIVALFACFIKIQSDRGKYLTVLSLVFAVLASEYFPWDWLEMHTILGRILCQVQFPTRWLCILTVLLSLLLGEMLSEDGKILEKFTGLTSRCISYIIVAITLLITIYYVGMCMEQNITARRYLSNTEEFNVYVVGMAEYLIEGTDRNLLPGDYIFTDVSCNDVNKKGTRIELSAKTNQVDGYIEVPLINYKYYSAWDEKGNGLDIINGDNNRVGVIVPADFEGKIYIDFVPPVLWNIALFISALMVLFIIASIVYPIMKRKRTEE